MHTQGEGERESCLPYTFQRPFLTRLHERCVLSLSRIAHLFLLSWPSVRFCYCNTTQLLLIKLPTNPYYAKTNNQFYFFNTFSSSVSTAWNWVYFFKFFFLSPCTEFPRYQLFVDFLFCINYVILIFPIFPYFVTWTTIKTKPLPFPLPWTYPKAILSALYNFEHSVILCNLALYRYC